MSGTTPPTRELLSRYAKMLGVSASVKVSSRFQIAIPAEVRRQLGVKKGDRLLVHMRGDHVVLMPEPKSYADKLRGLHTEAWAGVDTDEYVRREREAWTD